MSRRNNFSCLIVIGIDKSHYFPPAKSGFVDACPVIKSDFYIEIKKNKLLDLLLFFCLMRLILSKYISLINIG